VRASRPCVPPGRPASQAETSVPFESACGHPHGAVCLRLSRRLRAHSSASVSRLR
jgi:hypothetical protein